MISINALRACDYYSHSATQRGLLIWLSLLAIFNALSWVLPIVSRVSRQNTKKLEAGYGNGSWRLRGAQSISSAVFIQFSTQLSHDRYTFYFVLAQIYFCTGRQFYGFSIVMQPIIYSFPLSVLLLITDEIFTNVSEWKN